MPSPNLYRAAARNESLFIDMIDMGFITPPALWTGVQFHPRIRESPNTRTCVQAGNDYEFNLHVQTISEKWDWVNWRLKI